MSDTGRRDYPDRPVVGVAGVVVAPDGRVVLVRRGRPPLEGRWSLPGGMLELGEPLREGVAREVREETGLDVDVGPVVDAIDHIERDESGGVVYHYALVDFLCRIVGGAIRPDTDASDVCLAPPDGLADYGLSATTRRVIDRAVEQAGRDR